MLKKLSLVLVITAVFGLLAAGAALSQGGRGRRIHYSKLFDPGTITTVSGKVLKVMPVISGNGRNYCLHSLLTTPKGQVTAVLAPQNYLATKGLTLKPGDRITATGSLVTIQGKPFLLVTEMRGDRTMKLREENGRPAWAVGNDWHAH